MRGLKENNRYLLLFFLGRPINWPYSRFSQTANEEGNALWGGHPVITECPHTKEWQIPIQNASSHNLSAQPRHNG